MLRRRHAARAVLTSDSVILRHSSTAASSSSVAEVARGSKPLPNAFSRATTWSLIRALIVFQSCKIPNIELLAPRWLKKAEKIVGSDLAYNTFAKWFFFDHFCAGRDLDELQVACQSLAKQNIGAILDYAAEAELHVEENDTNNNNNNGGSPSKQQQQQQHTSTVSHSQQQQQALNHLGIAEENEEDRFAKQVAVDAAKSVERDLDKAAEMFKQAVVHDPSPVDVVEKVYRLKRGTSASSAINTSSTKDDESKLMSGLKLSMLRPRIEVEKCPAELAASFGSRLPPQHSQAVYYATEDQLRFTKPMIEMIMNVDRFLTCINNAGELRSYRLPVAYAALKPTALCDTLLLSRLNSVLLGIRADWLWFSHPTLANITPLQQCRLLLVGKEKQQEQISIISVKTFKETLLAREKVVNKDGAGNNNILTEEHIDLLIDELDPTGSQFIDYLTYTQYAAEALCGFAGSAISDPEYIVKKKKRMIELGHSSSENEKHQQLIYNIFNRIHRGLYQQELDHLQLFYKRFDDVIQQCFRKSTRIMVDAEQTYYQTAIDHVVRELQRKYNKKEPIVSNTYQAYTEISLARVINDVRRSEREGWIFAAKIVRGAYMEEEGNLAKLYGYRSPIWEKKELTDMCYNSMADRLLKLCRETPQINYGILFGTHNPQSTYYISEQVTRLPIECKCQISFAQLLGMSDDLTFFLTRQGFSVFKYLPYGPVKETLAYLMRRAQENKSMMRQENPSIPMMKQELMKRSKKAALKYSAIAFVLWLFYSKFFSQYTLVLKKEVAPNDSSSK